MRKMSNVISIVSENRNIDIVDAYNNAECNHGIAASSPDLQTKTLQAIAKLKKTDSNCLDIIRQQEAKWESTVNKGEEYNGKDFDRSFSV